MEYTKEDERDLLKLADIIEGKQLVIVKDDGILLVLPENKRDGSQFTIHRYFFDCGTPACVAGHAFVSFPKKFSDSPSACRFAKAFNLSWKDSDSITDPDQYKSRNPRPKTVAKRIRMIAKQAR